MASALTLTSLLLMTINVLHVQSNQLTWSPDEYLNPWKSIDAQACGLGSGDPRFADLGYICDPNGVVGAEVKNFQKILKAAATNETKCPCSTYYCEHSGPKGYRIGVALVNKMKLEKGSNDQVNTPSAQAQIFAYKVLNKWRMGRVCNEDILIFYSLKDKVLSMHAGSTAEAKLDHKRKNIVTQKTGQLFDEGKTVEALHSLIYNIKLILNCESKVHDCGASEMFRAGGGNSANQLCCSVGVIGLVSLWVAFRKFLF